MQRVREKNKRIIENKQNQNLKEWVFTWDKTINEWVKRT